MFHTEIIKINHYPPPKNPMFRLKFKKKIIFPYNRRARATSNKKAATKAAAFYPMEK